MKITRIFPAILLLLTLLAGCSKDKPYFDNPGDNPGPSDGATGYLDLSDFVLSISIDTEQFPSTGDPTLAGAYPGSSFAGTTRAGSTSEAPSDFLITIVNNKTSETAFSGKYAELKALSKLTLVPASYTITAQSANFASIPLAEWNTPAFFGTKNFTIIKNTTTSLSGASGLVCTLGNIKATVSLSADLDRLFKPDTDTEKLTATVSLGENSLVFSRTETKAAYFKAVAASNTLSVRLKGKYNKAPEGETPVYTNVDWRQEIPGCKAGQWRNITITVMNADKGNIQFQLTVQTWAYDEKIDVDVTTYYIPMEEVIPDEDVSDPNAPTISLDGKDITRPFELNSSMFDFDVNTCSNMITAVASPKAGSTVEKLSIVFGSDNAEFLAALAAAGYIDNRVELWPSNAESTLKTYVVMKPSGNDLMAKVTFAGMKGLYDYAGTHTVKFIATDSQKRTSYTTMTILVSHGEGPSGDGPSVVWKGGYDFNTRYANLGLDVVIDITSQTGITGFTIDINSDVLTPAILEEIGLAAHMDLINPGAMGEVLTAVGIKPIGKDVEGKTAVTFDISSFMPMVSALGTGMCDFTINVTDTSGTTSRTIKLTVVQE